MRNEEFDKTQFYSDKDLVESKETYVTLKAPKLPMISRHFTISQVLLIGILLIFQLNSVSASTSTLVDAEGKNINFYGSIVDDIRFS